MSSTQTKRGPYPKASKGAEHARLHVDSPQTRSPSYELAFQDGDFLLRDELRPVRLQLELWKPELIIQEHKIDSTIVIFGSARTPGPEAARQRLELAKTELSLNPHDPELKKKVESAERAIGNSRY